MKKYLLALLSFAATTAVAQDYLGTYSLHDVVVPTIFGDPASADKIQGMIYYDSTAGQFKAIGNSSTPVVLGTTSSGAVNSSGTSERLERAKLDGSTGSITSQSGTWVASTTKASTGRINLTLTSGIFSAAPACVCSIEYNVTTPSDVCGFKSISASTIEVITTSSSTGNPTDRNFSIVCMGNH